MAKRRIITEEELTDAELRDTILLVLKGVADGESTVTIDDVVSLLSRDHIIASHDEVWEELQELDSEHMVDLSHGTIPHRARITTKGVEEVARIEARRVRENLAAIAEAQEGR